MYGSLFSCIKKNVMTIYRLSLVPIKIHWFGRDCGMNTRKLFALIFVNDFWFKRVLHYLFARVFESFELTGTSYCPAPGTLESKSTGLRDCRRQWKIIKKKENRISKRGIFFFCAIIRTFACVRWIHERFP